MEFEDIKTFIDTNKDSNEDLKSYLQGLNPLTVDGVQKFITDNKDAKSWFDSEKDKHSGKSLETWKQNNLTKMIDEEINKRFPEESEEKKLVKKLQVDLENMKQEAIKKDLLTKIQKIAVDKHLPLDIVEFFISQDEESTIGNLSKLESVFNKHVESLVEARVKGNSYTPPGGGKNNNQPDFSKMTDEEYYAYQKQQKNKK